MDATAVAKVDEARPIHVQLYQSGIHIWNQEQVAGCCRAPGTGR